MAKSKRIRAVAYLRMSTDDQSLSPEQQRREVQEYADRNGYEIVRWYVDEGISASKCDERRLEYQQLLIDSSSGEWQAVLCWSTSRFTRNHPHEAATGKKILRLNGVYLDTVKEGRIDWNTFEGVMKDTLFNLLDHKYSVDLGRDSLRGRRNTFLAGGYPHGSIPYGYAHLYVCGEERRVVPRTEKTKNLRGWMHYLSVVETEAEVVRRIFRLYVEDDKSMCAIARILNNETVPGPGRGKNAIWTVQNVRRRLRCPVYVRISRIGKPQRKREAHNRIPPEERLGDWPALVDSDLWDRAQAKLQSNGAGHAHEGKSGVLQGILRCGMCGYVLHKENPRKPGDRRGDKYRCASTARGLQVDCRRWTVYEAEILPLIARELVSAVDEETRRLLEARPGEPVKIANGDALRAHLAGLEKKISQAAESFLLPNLGTSMRMALETKVEELTAEAEETRLRLEALQAAVDMGGVERFIKWWQQVRGQLLVLAGETAARPDDMAVIKARDDQGRMVPVAMVVAAGNGLAAIPLHEGTTVESVGPFPVVGDAGKVRALLKRLNACVKVYWRRPTEEERRLRRKGRGHGCPGRLPEWVVDHARLEVVLHCGSSDRPNVSANSRDTSAHEYSRHRANREQGGNP